MRPSHSDHARERKPAVVLVCRQYCERVSSLNCRAQVSRWDVHGEQRPAEGASPWRAFVRASQRGRAKAWLTGTNVYNHRHTKQTNKSAYFNMT
eukprot:1115574-Pleurochrysis_carterae.AAC.1